MTLLKRNRNPMTAFALVSLLLFAGCSASAGSSAESGSASASAEPGRSAASQAPISGGDLTYGLATSPDSLDPHVSGLDVASRVFRSIYDSLVFLTEDNQIKPWLASEWSVSPDGKRYTFKLRQDVKFHDGTPFNAEAVKKNFDRIVDPSTEASIALSYLTQYESSEVVDPYTVRFNLKKPSAAFLRNLSQPSLAIVSPTAAEKYGKQLGQHPVGTGPFRFVKWEENSEIKLERNPDYNWAPDAFDNQGKPYLDTVTFKIIPEEATRIGSLQSGQVLAIETVPAQNVAALKNDSRFTIASHDALGLPFALFINERQAPWNDLKARQALQLGIDVDAIVKTLYFGVYKRAWSPLAPGTFGYDPALENGIQSDKEKAKRLLDELGWKPGKDGIREKDGKKLTIRYVESIPNKDKKQDIAAIVQQQLKEIGVAVELHFTKDVSQVVLMDHAYELFGGGTAGLDPSALTTFYHTHGLTGWPSLSGFDDPKLDELLERGETELDDAKRLEIYQEAQHYIVDHAVTIPIYVSPSISAVSKKVENLKYDALGYLLLHDTTVRN
ncbi:ABC transporter substrate-binding protein [Cohnella caldifontis]|uniref:ABC transporter substrate-binding protein n=1 Tax=Cohnella caldifontis TaxID=3027471 RepID=UPI0023ED0532|nr:ABC transporter substrate-binding protein [Cohnella sp. YIM B05605]